MQHPSQNHYHILDKMISLSILKKFFFTLQIAIKIPEQAWNVNGMHERHTFA